jgi:MHS family proline/betaine transporter-like MFS transporter
MFGLLMSAPLLACIMGSVPMLLIKLFPAPVRYSGIGVSYNMGFSLLAGTSPMLVAFLISYTGIKMVPAFFIMFIVLCAFPVILFLNKKAKQLNNGYSINSELLVGTE